MICEKTGAQLYLEEYGEWLIGDVYRVNDGTLIARISGRSHRGPQRDMTHYRVRHIAHWFDRDDPKVYSMLVAEEEDVTDYGYNGIKSDEVPL